MGKESFLFLPYQGTKINQNIVRHMNYILLLFRAEPGFFDISGPFVTTFLYSLGIILAMEIVYGIANVSSLYFHFKSCISFK